MLRRDYFGKGWRDRYDGGTMELEKGETKQEIKCQPLTDMLFVKVKSDFRRENPDCYVYGHVSVKVGQSEALLFSRHREAPAHVVIGHALKNFLTLPDLPHGAASPPPLEAVTKSNPILLTMKLHEKKSSGEDELLVDVTDFEHKANVEGRCSGFSIDDGADIWFMAGFAVMTGARAEIKVKIKTPPGSKSPVPIKAKIEAIQYLKYCHSCCGQAVRTLYDYDKSKEVYVGDGGEIPLQHSIVGLPTVEEQFLSILIRPETDVPRKPVFPMDASYLQDEDEEHLHYLVDFPLQLATETSFVTNSEMTHTKDVLGTPYSVSIRILPDPERPLQGA